MARVSEIQIEVQNAIFHTDPEDLMVIEEMMAGGEEPWNEASRAMAKLVRFSKR